MKLENILTFWDLLAVWGDDIVPKLNFALKSRLPFFNQLSDLPVCLSAKFQQMMQSALLTAFVKTTHCTFRFLCIMSVCLLFWQTLFCSQMAFVLHRQPLTANSAELSVCGFAPNTSVPFVSLSVNRTWLSHHLTGVILPFIRPSMTPSTRSRSRCLIFSSALSGDEVLIKHSLTQITVESNNRCLPLKPEPTEKFNLWNQ